MISIEQNSEKQLHRLAAQRQLYASAKSVFGWQVFISAPVALASAVWVLLQPDVRGYVAAWGLLVTLADLFWLTPWQKGLRTSAAKIQEAFDCDVLELKWNELKVGKLPDPELVKEKSKQYDRWTLGMPSLENWYPKQVDKLPLQVGRVICQRANCWWDSNQRRRYAAWIIGVVVSIFIVVLAISMRSGVGIEELILKGILPLAPALLLGTRQFMEQREAADRLEKLKDHCGSIWKAALEGKSKTVLTDMSRNLQDEIFDNRRKTPPVLDFVFARLRDNFEVQMNHASAHYVAEAKARLKFQGAA